MQTTTTTPPSDPRFDEEIYRAWKMQIKVLLTECGFTEQDVIMMQFNTLRDALRETDPHRVRNGSAPLHR